MGGVGAGERGLWQRGAGGRPSPRTRARIGGALPMGPAPRSSHPAMDKGGQRRGWDEINWLVRTGGGESWGGWGAFFPLKSQHMFNICSIEVLKLAIRSERGTDREQMQYEQQKWKRNYIHPHFYRLHVVKFSKQVYEVTQLPAELAIAFSFHLMESLSCFLVGECIFL